MVEGNSDKMIEHYRLIKLLGDGSYGVAWQARDTK
jgi:hypothetical protein